MPPPQVTDEGRSLLKTLEAAGVARVTLEPFHQLAEELKGFFLVMVDENAFDENLVNILEHDLFFCHADLLRVFVTRYLCGSEGLK
jgi:hypothetical protein